MNCLSIAGESRILQVSCDKGKKKKHMHTYLKACQTYTEFPPPEALQKKKANAGSYVQFPVQTQIQSLTERIVPSSMFPT